MMYYINSLPADSAVAIVAISSVAHAGFGPSMDHRCLTALVWDCWLLNTLLCFIHLCSEEFSIVVALAYKQNFIPASRNSSCRNCNLQLFPERYHRNMNFKCPAHFTIQPFAHLVEGCDQHFFTPHLLTTITDSSPSLALLV